jgi:hypothetical protein
MRRSIAKSIYVLSSLSLRFERDNAITRCI